jgi:lysophospholipase L1-like esterase
MKILILALILVVIGIIIYQAVRINRLAQKGGQLAINTVAFTQESPQPTARVVFIGDSSAVGTGAARPEESVPGRMGAEHPTVQIDNLAKNGRRVSDLVDTFGEVPKTNYNLMVIHAGGNDVLHLTSFDDLRRDLPLVLDQAKQRATHVALISGGDFSTAYIFPWPVNQFLGRRSRLVRDLFKEIAQEKGVAYVDIYSEDKRVEYKDPKTYYAADGFHPSSLGYQNWYSILKKTLEEAGVTL